MNYAKIRKFDVSNGPGVRSTLFVSGCTNKCEGCFNKELQDFNYGEKWTKDIEDDFIKQVMNPNIVGVNILGGEPMDQVRDEDLCNLLRRIKHETNKSIWLWSGYLYEDIIVSYDKRNILEYVDVLIDGRFEIEKRNISLSYRGSSNQRVIDIKKSRESNKIIEIEV
ncbi:MULTISPECIES: anaerobic ribonucleoside-triphosphate reductase activating protein [unclassified Clostridium]|jgi:anaerobic ribonucleoside-triphosphate reductase activating protein|uniref:anaerobic ribonucleoside-triphosphate reductase activating protein n=1 Tax=unclassified Clostridium TaxID=2614128 RepID=UPI0025BAF9E1|nr:anaerobic ribonucleoside-triphosphate reductase activating protein [Clostridium sp.]MCI6693430.1 anaerobic ribonucleoside-triphosphate reductase activating protein [Clostridium sp.]MDY2631258.1 anaerobic ribonucleoside-triphosphate reductase activating protein [Clostridium sp.]MDY4252374.1 anaerobic ribonucleoside-triphosphate reductase activating protein [Clostridium sp.]MDY6228428.1 anaerobic ribonucleoside-triphosphate reductase activating protein [Clostridium sp.]